MTPLRAIFIGDIHGCYDELEELLDRIAPGDDDAVVSVGDIVRKGPAPERCLELWREHGWKAVRGNQETKLLKLVEGGKATDPPDRIIAARRDLIDYIGSLPLLLDFADLATAVVHGGLLPGTEITPVAIEAQRESVMTLRYVRTGSGGWEAVPKNLQQPGDRFWSELWDGDRTIVYGHTPRPEVRRDPKAIGIDTGCVYGGKLTAAVLRDGQWNLVQVPARRAYASPS